MCPHEVRVCEATLQLDSIVTENVDHILGDNNLGDIFMGLGTNTNILSTVSTRTIFE